MELSAIKLQIDVFVDKHKKLLELENAEEEEAHKSKAGKMRVSVYKTNSADGRVTKVKFVVIEKPESGTGFILGDTVVCLRSLMSSSVFEMRGILLSKDDNFLSVCFKARDWREGSLGQEFYLLNHHDEFTFKTMTRALEKIPRYIKYPVAQIAFGKDKLAIKDLLTEEDGVFSIMGTLSFRNEKLSMDQKVAVSMALRKKNLMIIQGPPGTGKTTTLVEIIHQLCKQDKRVLVCAPTNVAVDNLVLKVAETEFEPLRIGNVMRMAKEVRDYSMEKRLTAHPKYYSNERILKRICDDFDDEEDIYDLLEEFEEEKSNLTTRVLRHHPAIFSTLSMATVDDGVLKFIERTFDVVIIDEASQALEAASWIAIPNAKKLILAGDVFQLQPMVSSQQAKKQGLGVSMMERLISKLGKESYVSLKTQFRMNQKIMAWSNKHFYNGNLVAHESVKNHVMSNLSNVLSTHITREAVMLIDTADCGDKCKEVKGKGTSLGNIGEAIIVAQLIKYLVTCCRVNQDAIGVITPYQLQTNFIQKLLKDFPKVEVSTVDGFQGREKEAIILSFVRSNASNTLGFVRDERRLNVAVTRAKKFLALVCDTSTFTIRSSRIIHDLLEHFKANGICKSGKLYLNDENNEKYELLSKISEQGRRIRR